MLTTLHTAWAIVERRIVEPSTPLSQRAEMQIAFFLGTHAALTALAGAGDHAAVTDVRAILEDEVDAFFEMLGLSTATPN